MPANLGLDDEIATLKAVGDTDTDWHTKFSALIRAALHSASNPFGSAALRNTGTAAGTIPLLGTGGRLAAEHVPLIPPSKVTGTLQTPDSATDLADQGATDQLPGSLKSTGRRGAAIPASLFTSGTLAYQSVSPFGPGKITGRLDAARVPPSSATGQAITAVSVRSTLNLTGSRTRATTPPGGGGYARLTARTMAVDISSGTLNLTIAHTAEYKPNMRDTGGPPPS